MKVIYQVGDEKDIRAFVVFAKAADGKLYNEADFKTQVKAADAQNAFEKNMLVVDAGEDGLFRPVAFAIGDAAVVVTVTSGESAAELVSWVCAD